MKAIWYRCRKTSARESSEEGGFTLIELVTTMGLLLLVVGALLGIFESVQRSAGFVQERAETLDSMRLAVDQMTKEIRQASVVTPDAVDPGGALQMETYILGIERTISYEVDGENLTRTVDGGTPVVVQNNLSSSSLFTYTTDPNGAVQVVAVNLEVHPIRRPETIVVLNSEVRLRNRIAVP